MKLAQIKLSRIAVFGLVLASQLTSISSASAATATATGTHPNPSQCNQTVSDATNVEVVRLSSGDCVVLFKSGTVSWTTPQGLTNSQVLLVGGGGGGGGTFDTRGAGGGGAGQVNSNSTFEISGGNIYSIAVGANGAGGVQAGATMTDRRTNQPGNVGSVGGNSSVSLSGSQLLIAYGGLGGCASRTTVYETYCTSPTFSQTGGAAATLTSGGGRGGAGGGGGGGSLGAGVGGVGGAGGTGTAISITGSSVTYGTGGVAGRNNANALGVSASANTGDGGGGASSGGAYAANGGDGGSGLVVIRFSPDFVPSAPTLNSVTPGNKSLTIVFTVGSDYGASITDYEYSLNGGSYTSAGTISSPITISGLSGRTNYSVSLKARNGNGLSLASGSLSAITIDSASDASEAAAIAKKAKEQRELTELLAVIPSIARLAFSIGDLTNSLLSTQCIKGKTTKYVKNGAKCPKGYVKKK